MTRSAEVRRCGGSIDQGLDGFGPVMRRNACGTTISKQVDRYGECSFMKRCIVIDHQAELQLFTTVFQQRGAYKSPAEFAHKIDDLGSNVTGGSNEIPF